LEDQQTELKEKFDRVKASIIRCKEKFKAIEVQYDASRPLIGVVGEIFCRLNRFSNENLIRRIEEQGGECWLSDVGEWIWYTNWEQQKNLSLEDKRFSKEMLKVKLTGYVQKKYEHQLYAPFHEEFKGYEEPEVETMMKYVEKYLPPIGSLGEMVLSVGKTLYLYNKGADGIVDISPFSCMNGIVCEGVYPRVSQDCDNMPIRIFYFDGTQSDLERDIGIFIELARNYQRRKKIKRVYPPYFDTEKMAG
jgi:predicted nucleotide-binding protein (sugar kinase/HSP70/actin superfamily)